MSYCRLAALALASLLMAAGTAAEPGGSHLPAGPRQNLCIGAVLRMASTDCPVPNQPCPLLPPPPAHHRAAPLPQPTAEVKPRALSASLRQSAVANM